MKAKIKVKRSILSLLLCLVMVLSIMPTMPTQAAAAKLSVILKEDGSVSWDKLSDIRSCSVVLSVRNDPYGYWYMVDRRDFVDDTNNCRFDSAMYPGNEYKVTVKALNKTGGIAGEGTSDILTLSESQRKMPAVTKVSGKPFVLSWSPVSGASGYFITMFVIKNGKNIRTTSTFDVTETSFDLNKVQYKDWGKDTDGCDYFFRVYAYYKNSQNTITTAADSPLFPAKRVNVYGSEAKVSGDGKYFEGTVATVFAGTKEGYTFDHWESSDSRYNNSKDTTLCVLVQNENISLTAIWSKGYTITFDSMGGNILGGENTMTTKEDGTLGSLPTPAMEGYYFDGWYNNGELVTASTVFSKATTLRAQWIKRIAITFDFNDGSGYKKVRYADKDGQIIMSGTPKSSGKKFLGWFTKPDDSGVQVTINTFKADNVFYAHWEELPKDTTSKYGVTVLGLGNGGGIYNYDMEPTTEFKEGEDVYISLGTKPGYVITDIEADCPFIRTPGAVEFNMPADFVVVDIKWMNLTPTIDGFTYKLETSSGTGYTYQAKITGAENLSGDVIIPSQIVVNDMVIPVTGIDGNNVFKGNKNITSVTLPNSIIDIGSQAFMGCENLEFVILSNRLSLYDYSNLFAGCKKLNNVHLPSSWAGIPAGIFDGRTAMEIVYIPGSVTKIEANAFQGLEGSLDTVVFQGTESQWKALISDANCASGNDVLKSSGLNVIFDHMYGGETYKPLAGGMHIQVCDDCGKESGGMYCTPNEEPAIEKYVAPSSLENGSRDIVDYCKYCKQELTRITEIIPATGEKPVEVPNVSVSYRTHVQSIGWQNYVKDGKSAGTYGMAKRLEGINIKVEGNDKLGVIYTTHCQTYGWLPWSSNGDMNGTEGEAKRLEAIEIKLTGADKDKYDIYYRVHAQSYGWLGWAKNGAPAGTAGYAKRLEAIQIVVKKKGEAAPSSNPPVNEGVVYKDSNNGGIAKAFYAKDGQSPIVNNPSTSNTNPVIPGESLSTVAYRTHVQSYGWQGWKFNGQMSGTSGEAKRLEGIEIKLVNKQYSGGITYRTHVQSYGWQGWKNNGDMAGTSGEAKRLEAIEIKLTGEMANQYDVYYRVHAQSYGWLGWAKNGASSGTAGYGKRLEGIQIVLVKKGDPAPANTYMGITSVNPSPYIEK